MRRREFIAGLGGAAAWPVVARAQKDAVRVIGFLHPASLETRSQLVPAFHRGLAEAGYIEGRNVSIEYRWAEFQNDRLPALAADLVRREVAVIALAGTPAALAAKAATRSIPIVFNTGSDPVQIGLVTSLNRPGGNLTGVSTLQASTTAKCLELMRELMPAAKSLGFLVNQTNPVFSDASIEEVQPAARALGVRMLILYASSEKEIEAALEKLVREQAGALVVNGDTFFLSQSYQLGALAIRHAVPIVTQYREVTAAGGLMSYGTNQSDAHRIVGEYTGRILNGEKPADLPVQQVTKIELVINLKTAKALGVSIPETLLATADKVIE